MNPADEPELESLPVKQHRPIPRVEIVVFGAAIAGLLTLFFVVPPDGVERGAWVQFLGRFHPVFIHFPIALLAVVPLLEVAGWFSRWKHLRAAAGFLLELATVSVLFATLLGWLLAYGGGESGDLVNAHFRGGVFLSIAALLCLSLRRRRVGVAYGLALLVTVAMMGWTSHLGGALTHGDDYLTKHMPAKVRAWLGISLPVVPVRVESFYGARVLPIFKQSCVSCHGEKRQKNGLRVDIYPALMAGGKHGPVIVPGDPSKSELYFRITLSPDHDDFMPANGKNLLSAVEIRVIEQWIAGGASASKPVTEFPDESVAAVAKPIEVVKLSAGIGDYHARFEAILAFNQLGIGRLAARSQRAEDGLVLHTAGMTEQCDDAMLQRLAPLADLIVDAELARTAVTDDGLRSLTAWVNLRSLDLSHTRVGAPGLEALRRLPHLETVNLTGTRVGEASVAQLRQRPNLHHVYAFGLKPMTP